MKIQNILLALAMTWVLASCSNPIQNHVDQINAKCPIEFGDAGKFVSATLEGDNNVVLTIEVQPSVVQTIQANTPNAHEVVVQAVTSQAPVFKDLFNALIKRNGTFSFRFTDALRKYEYTQVFKSDELESILKTSAEPQTPEKSLAQVLFSTNKELPLVTNVLTMDSLVDDGDYVRYYATVDTLFDSMFKNQAALHDNLLHEMTSGKETLPFINAVVECQKGIAYLYMDRKTGRKIDVLLTLEELDKALGN